MKKGEQRDAEPRCGVIVEVFDDGWRLEYMSLPVGKHRLYAKQLVYAAPPSRDWVSLTEAEIAYIVFESQKAGVSWVEICRDLEAALRKKNGRDE